MTSLMKTFSLVGTFILLSSAACTGTETGDGKNDPLSSKNGFCSQLSDAICQTAAVEACYLTSGDDESVTTCKTAVAGGCNADGLADGLRTFRSAGRCALCGPEPVTRGRRTRDRATRSPRHRRHPEPIPAAIRTRSVR